MKALKGLATDTALIDTPPGYYKHGRNGVINDVTFSVSNEKGFTKLTTWYPYKLIGQCEKGDITFIFSGNNTNSAISVMINDIVTTRIDDNFLDYKLNFKTNKPISCRALKNHKGEWILAFKDGINPLRIINIDHPNISNINDINLFPNYKIPVIDYDVKEGGALKSGAYFPFVRYSDKDGNVTDYIPVGKAVYLGTYFKGINSGRQINLYLTGIDTTFDFIEVAWLQINNDVTKAVFGSKHPTSESLTVGYTSEGTVTISLEEITATSPVYIQADTIGVHQNRLLFGGVEEEPEIEYQQWANDIKIIVKSTLIEELIPQSYTCQINEKQSLLTQTNYNSGKQMTFLHQEVYAFYISLVFKNGRRSRAFIIPGANPTLADLAQTEQGTYECIVGKRYQYDDTCQLIDKVQGLIRPGIWINDTEYYPDKDEFTFLRGRKVLHHRMPSIRYCKENLYLEKENYGKDTLDALGVMADNVVIPQHLQDKVVGYEIYYAERNVDNSTILGESLVLYEAKRYQSQDVNELKSTGANWSVAWNGGGTDLETHKDYIRFHAFDMLLNKPAIQGTLLFNHLKIRKTFIATDQANREGLEKLDQDIYVQIIDNTVGDVRVTTAEKEGFGKLLKSSAYIPAAAYTDKYDNRVLESAYISELRNQRGMNLEHVPFLRNPQNDNFAIPTIHDTYLSSIGVIRSDVYKEFYTQGLVGTGKIQTGFRSEVVYGDSFISDYSFVTYGQRESNDISPDHGFRFVHRFIGETSSNVSMRQEEIGNIYSNWYPKSSPKWLQDLKRNFDPNQSIYLKEFNKPQIFTKVIPYNPYDDSIVTKHTGRIVASLEQQKEFASTSWRTFRQFDYFNIGQEYGRITDLQSIDGQLVIKTEHEVLVTRGLQTLGEGTEIMLKTAKLFEENPLKVIDDDIGVVGGTHQIGVQKCPFGYVFVDQHSKSIYVYKGGLRKLNNMISNFFFDNLRNRGDNPYQNDGYVIGYDSQYNRLLLTANGNQGFTISYALGKNVDNWVFYHDYKPQSYIRNRDNLYCVVNDEIYKMNDGPYGNYADGQPKPFSMDYTIVNNEQFTLNSVNWQSELLENGIYNEFDTITSILAYNQYQCSNKVRMYRNSWDDHTFRKLNDRFNSNEFTDELNTRGGKFLDSPLNHFELLPNVVGAKEFYDKSPLVGKCLVVRLEYDNARNARLTLQDVGVNPSKAVR